MTGTLYIVGTPIGNLGDLSGRMREALCAADVIFAEDTRVSSRLLHHLGIDKPLLSCHDHNERARAEKLAEYAAAGKSVALVSDAGLPLVSDPGHAIVQSALELGMKITPVPGPSACLAALVASGIAASRFVFEGFLPDKKGDRRRRIQSLKPLSQTLIFYVTVPELERVLGDLCEILGCRKACLAREITKLYEEFIRGTLDQILESVSNRELKGELVLVVEGAKEMEKMSCEDVASKVSELLSSGGRLKDIAHVLSQESGWSSSDIYKIGLSLDRE